MQNVQRHRPIASAALTVSFVLLAATVALAQPGSGPWIRAASGLEGTIVTIVRYIAVISMVGAVFAWVWDHHGHMFGWMVKLALGLSVALGAREFIAMFY